jgi:hypothetical protein
MRPPWRRSSVGIGRSAGHASTVLQSVDVNPAAAPSSTTALALRPVNYGALATTTLARSRLAPADAADEPAILSWSLVGLDAFSLTPTILQALNRLRVLSGLEPLRMRPDGTLDLFDDPLLFRMDDHAPAFAQ